MILTLDDLTAYIHGESIHVKGCATIDKDGRVDVWIMLEWWYNLWYGRRYMKHMEQVIEANKPIGARLVLHNITPFWPWKSIKLPG